MKKFFILKKLFNLSRKNNVCQSTKRIDNNVKTLLNEIIERIYK